MKLRLLTTGLVASFVLAAVGCGSSGGSKSAAASASGATLVRSDALALVSIDSDLGSSQWKQVDDLSHKFPGRSKALARINDALAKKGLDYNRDVKPALGPEVDIAFATDSTFNETAVVALTKPDDPAKFKQLVAKLNAQDTSGSKDVYREVGGWYALSDSQAHIDRVLKGSGNPLSGESTFDDALAKLPDDALVKAYVNGPALASAIKATAQQSSSSFDSSTLGLDKLDFISASLSAENDGIRLRGAVKGASDALGSGDYSTKLLGDVPGNAFALLDFNGTGIKTQLDKAKSNSSFKQAVQQIEATLGVSVDDLAGLFDNEVASYIRPGAVIPEFTLALDSNDESAALATLDKVAAKIAALTGAVYTGGAERTLNFGSVSVHYGGKNGRVVITTATNGIGDFGGSGDKLPDSADFKEAKSAAGLPDSNAGVLYLNLKDSIALAESFANLAGSSIPTEVSDNLRPLRSFVAWAAGSGDTRTFDAFLEIK